MKLEITFLHSKLARRILRLFVLCALIPMAVLAAVSLRNVTAQLQEQNRQQLHRAARDEAIAIYERLSLLEAAMKLLTLGGAGRVPAFSSVGFNGLPSHLVNGLEGLELITPDGNRQTLFGGTGLQFDFTLEEQKFLRSGKSI